MQLHFFKMRWRQTFRFFVTANHLSPNASQLPDSTRFYTGVSETSLLNDHPEMTPLEHVKERGQWVCKVALSPYMDRSVAAQGQVISLSLSLITLSRSPFMQDVSFIKMWFIVSPPSKQWRHRVVVFSKPSKVNTNYTVTDSELGKDACSERLNCHQETLRSGLLICFYTSEFLSFFFSTSIDNNSIACVLFVFFVCLYLMKDSWPKRAVFSLWSIRVFCSCFI